MNNYFERTINVKHMCKEIFSRWKIILICILTGMLVFSVIAIAKYRYLETDVVESVSETNSPKELSEESLKQVQILLEYEKMYETKKQYYEDSVLMNLDSNKINTGKLILQLKSSAEGQADLIAELYKILITDGSGLEKIATTEKVTEQQLKELVSVRTVAPKIENSNQTKEVLLEVTVLFGSQSGCQELLDSIKRYIDEQKATMEEKMGIFDLNVVEENISENSDTDIMDKQNSEYNNVIALGNEVKNRISLLNTDELNYYMSIKGIKTEEEPDTFEADVEIGYKVYIKYAFIGALFGLVAAIGFMILQYVFSNYLKAEDDIEEIYGIWEIQKLCEAVITKGKTKNTNIEDESGKEELAAVKIANVLRRENTHDLLIVVDVNMSKIGNEKIENVIKKLKMQLINVCVVNGTEISASDMKKVLDIKNAVVVCEAKETRYKDMAQNIKLLQRLKIEIVGAIVA